MKTPIQSQFRDKEPPSRLDRQGRTTTPLPWIWLVVALFIVALLVHFLVGLPGGGG